MPSLALPVFCGQGSLAFHRGVQNHMKKIKAAKIVFGCFLALFILYMIYLNVTLSFPLPGDAPVGVEIARAKVISVLSDTLAPDPEYPFVNIGIQELEFEIISGNDAGTIIVAKNFVGRTDNHPAEVGTVMILASYDDFVTATVENYSREREMGFLVLLFFAVVLFFGRRKGAQSILALGFSLTTIVFFFVPLVIKGMNPILASILMVIISTSVSHILINGFTAKSYVATLGCILCTAFAGGMACAVGKWIHLSSLQTAEAEDLFFISSYTSISFKDLIFAGILIATLGAITDTTMSIASAVYEMKTLNPDLGYKALWKSGMNVGRDIMGTMTDTLILAFTGSSVNLLVIFYMYQYSWLQLFNMDLMVIEIVQGICGSIAVVFSIPFTAWLSAWVFGHKERHLQKIEKTV